MADAIELLRSAAKFREAIPPDLREVLIEQFKIKGASLQQQIDAIKALIARSLPKSGHELVAMRAKNPALFEILDDNVFFNIEMLGHPLLGEILWSDPPVHPATQDELLRLEQSSDPADQRRAMLLFFDSSFDASRLPFLERPLTNELLKWRPKDANGQPIDLRAKTPAVRE